MQYNTHFTSAVSAKGLPYDDSPQLNDDRLKIELVSKGIKQPTNMAFLGPNDIIVSEKESGKLKRVVNGSILKEAILDVPVATERERGMLGLVTADNQSTRAINVFVYFTESQKKRDGLDNCPPPEPYFCEVEGEPMGNRLYRYELTKDKLVNPKMLLDLPSIPVPNHNGGDILIGPHGDIYIVIGDHLSYLDKNLFTKAQNVRDSKDPDGRGGILRLTQDGHTVGKGILGDSHPLNKYYAYGIRNSYGIDFDPLTGNLWDTENGPAYGDEINLVKPGFNSGWIKIQGIWQPQRADASANILELQQGKILPQPDEEDLVSFHGKGHYSSPEFIWNKTVGVTAIKFMTSDKLGKQYKNDLFVGDFNNGNIYHFDLTKDRTGLLLTGKLSDKIADNISEIDESNILFGQGFGGITDIEVSPYDGYLYFLSYHKGSIYRIVE